MNTEHERIKFEAACHRHAEEAGHEGAAKLERDGDGYADPATQAAWWGWREGRAALLAERDALRKALETMVKVGEMNGVGRAYAMKVARAALAQGQEET